MTTLLALALTVAVVAVMAGAIASVSGFGIGSLLTPLLAARVGTKLAVAAVSIPHVAATALRFWIMIASLWPFILVATAGAVIGTVAGERILRRVPEPLYRRLISVLVLALGIFMFFRIGQ